MVVKLRPSELLEKIKTPKPISPTQKNIYLTTITKQTIQVILVGTDVRVSEVFALEEIGAGGVNQSGDYIPISYIHRCRVSSSVAAMRYH